MKKALLVIDYTNDFVATDGKLTCGEPGQLLDTPIANLIEQFIAEKMSSSSLMIYMKKTIHFTLKQSFFLLTIFGEHQVAIYTVMLVKFITCIRIK